MNKWTLFTGVLMLCTLSTAGQVLAQGDAANGKAKSAVCAACHGTDGKALVPEYPNLAGQHEGYIAKQLTDYRDGNRNNALMAPMAANLSDQDILDIAAHFSSMPPIAGVAQEENLSHGENIYRGGISDAQIASCTGCHGPSGKGNPAANFPALGGQNTAYIAAQLRLFRSGERANDPNEMMRSLAHRLSDTEIDAVANYIAGLR